MRKKSSKNIVLLHGWGANAKKLEPLAVELTKKKWKVLVPQLPGFDAEEPGEDWGLKEYDQFVQIAARKAFGKGNYFLFGHSFGGRIAIKLAGLGPKNIEGIVLCATGGLSRGNPVKRGAFFILAKTGKTLLGLHGVAHFWQTALYKLAREHDYEKATHRMKNIFKKVVAENLRPKVKKIRLPVLILWGRKDRMTPISDAYYIKNTLPKAKLSVFENDGHKLPYDKPKEVAENIETWAKNLQ